jgi:hypothetical protein
MEKTVGNGAIKIACIQTVPGKEFDVYNEFDQACSYYKKKGELIDYSLMKGIGNFDIILVYASNDFNFHLRKAGPIEYVLKSNLLLCYQYTNRNIKDIFERLNKKVFSAFCLLKISPGMKNKYPEIDNLLRKYVNAKASECQLLGSLGWNELIIIISGDSIEKISNTLDVFEILLYESEQDYYSVILKTLSFISIRYDIVTKRNIMDKGFNKTTEILESISSLKTTEIIKDESNLFFQIEITAKKIHRRSIKNYFKNKGFSIVDSIGKRDLIAIPNKRINLAYFLSTLIRFRRTFKGKIFATNTRIQMLKTSNIMLKASELSDKIQLFDFEYEKLEEIFGQEMASNLSNQFYTLNSLSQNPLCRSVYADMSNYPNYIKATGEILKEEGGDFLYFAQGAREALKLGAELRSYGTYETIEEVTGRFSEVRGGCQLSLNSIALFPNYILKRINLNWEGFIITAYPKFQHNNAVINVPDTALWNPMEWWALYHEIGHIVVDNKPKWINEKIPEIQLFLSNKSNKFVMLDLLVELFSEVVGFELGFFGDYELYLKLLWEHLNKIDPIQTKDVSLHSYVIRTYFVELFLGHFRTHSNAPSVGKKDFTNLDFVFEGLINHMSKIEKNLDGIQFDNKIFIAADNAKLIVELFPFAKHMSDRLSEVKNLRPFKQSLRSRNTEIIIQNLKAGKIWLDRIVSPEAVLYKIFSEKDIKFNTKIASILSFWNNHMAMLKERFNV